MGSLLELMSSSGISSMSVRFGEHRRAIQNKTTDVVCSTLIKKDTNSRTSNLFHSNSLTLKENPYVDLANHFI